MMSAVAHIKIRFPDERLTDSVYRALLPDNKPLPKGLRIDMKRYGEEIMASIIDEESPMRLAATINDILESIETVLEAVRATGGENILINPG